MRTNPLIQYQQSCHSHLGERLRTPRRFSFFERQLLIVFCWTQYDSPHVTELSPTRAQFHGKIRETSQSNSIEARHDYRCQRRRDGRRVSAAMLRPITPDQDGLSAPKRWGRFFERVPHRTELSVFVGINLHGVQSKNLGAQWSVECSDIQKD
jgi:hypothetical protein